MDMLFPGTMRMPVKTATAVFGILANPASQTCAMTEPVSGRQPVMALRTRLLRAAVPHFPRETSLYETHHN